MWEEAKGRNRDRAGPTIINILMISPKDKPPCSLFCHKYAKGRANFFAANWSIGNPTDVFLLAFNAIFVREMRAAYCKVKEIVGTAAEGERGLGYKWRLI